MSRLSEFYSIGSWLSKKFDYHVKSRHRKVANMQVNQGEIWDCDLGFNIGEEKNKKRPVVILSANKVNRTGKVLVAPITEAKGKMSLKTSHLPQHPTWFLLHSDTQDSSKMYLPNRKIPRKSKGYSILDKDSVIQCEEMRSLSKARLLGKKGDLFERDSELLTKQIKKVFDIL